MLLNGLSEHVTHRNRNKETDRKTGVVLCVSARSLYVPWGGVSHHHLSLGVGDRKGVGGWLRDIPLR